MACEVCKGKIERQGWKEPTRNHRHRVALLRGIVGSALGDKRDVSSKLKKQLFCTACWQCTREQKGCVQQIQEAASRGSHHQRLPLSVIHPKGKQCEPSLGEQVPSFGVDATKLRLKPLSFISCVLYGHIACQASHYVT